MSDATDKRPGGTNRLTRRGFLQTGTAALAALGTGTAGLGAAVEKPPNFLFILCDQMNLDAMSAMGNPHVRTPNLDRLAARGVTFVESHSTNPVCSPARSSLFTGRMPVETGVIVNDRPIRPGMPNLGQWLGQQAGYDTAYCGKWHLPHGYPPPNTAGFRVLPSGGGQGFADDCWVSRTCEAYLRNRPVGEGAPFLLVASFMQPHDICYWMIHPDTLVPKDLPMARLSAELPALPPNHRSRPEGPRQVGNGYARFTTDDQWRYYLYCYYRMVEMLDSDVGRLLDALDESGHRDNTVVVFTADHGEGAGRHGNVQKWHPYDESMKVPMIWAGPGGIREGVRDTAHLVSGIDLMSTLCDYANIQTPPKARGRSLRPLLEGRPVAWRDHVVAEWKRQGRIVRTARHKFVRHGDDPVVQLFDMQKDPWEMTNLARDQGYSAIIQEHQRLLADWDSSMQVYANAG